MSTKPTPTISRAEIAGTAVTRPAGHVQSPERAPGEHDREAEPGQRGGEAEAEGDDQDHPERDLPLGDGAEQHDERRRARDQAGRGAHRDQPAPRELLGRRVRVAVLVVVRVAMRVVVMFVVMVLP